MRKKERERKKEKEKRKKEKKPISAQHTIQAATFKHIQATYWYSIKHAVCMDSQPATTWKPR